jgi:N-acetylmuramoyl-L-alanine amidase
MEENFTILQKTTCPAILIEWLFQDNKEDVKLLMDQATNSKLVDTLIIAIDKIDNNL